MAPSIFNAPVVETASAADTVVALAVFFAAVSEGALAVDQIAARLLWEIINDSQNANWTTINDAQTTTWTNVKTQS